MVKISDIRDTLGWGIGLGMLTGVTSGIMKNMNNMFKPYNYKKKKRKR